MNPLRLLQLWRERWGEPDFAGVRLHAPSYDPAAAWGGALTHAPLWSMRGATLMVLAFAVALLLFGGMTILDRPQQTAMAVVMIAVGFYVRGRAGTLAMLILSGLALLAGARYLAWRVLYTVPSGDAQVPGYLLWTAELCLLLAFACWLMTVIWPLYRPAHDRAPGLPERWPYLDVVLQPDTLDVSHVQALAALVERQEWPGAQLRLFVQRDGAVDPELARYVEARGYGWIEPFAGLPVPADSNGEYLVLVGGDHAASMLHDPEVLQRWSLWLRNDVTLAMLYSAGHPLASPLSAQAGRLLDARGTGRLALLRRSAITRLPGSAAGVDGTLDEALERVGYRTSVVGRPAHADRGGTYTPHQWMRIDDPANGESVRMRAQFLQLDGWLRACLPVALAVIAFAVLAIPLVSATPVNASFGWFASYAVPWAVLAFLAWSRAHAPFRRSMWRDLLDWSQAAILPFTVVAYAARALRSGLARRFPAGRDDDSAPATSPAPWLLLAGLLVAAAILRWDASEPAMRPWLAFAALVGGYAAVLQAARWAVEQEVRTLRQLHAAQRRIEAVVGLPDRHRLPALTSNFPDDPLELGFADAGASIPLEGSYIVTLTAGQISTTVRGTGTRIAEQRLRFQPSSDDLPDYRRFAASVRDSILREHYWLPSTPPTPRWLRTLGLAEESRSR